jgi:hypothetical protein
MLDILVGDDCSSATTVWTSSRRGFKPREGRRTASQVAGLAYGPPSPATKQDFYFVESERSSSARDWAVVRGSAREIEQIVHHLRLQFLDRVRHASIAALGRLQAAEAYAAVTRDMEAISQAATALTLASQAAILLVFTLLYLLWLSPLEFAVLAVAGGLIAAFAARRAHQDRMALDAAVGHERALLSDLAELLDGFKALPERRPPAGESGD